MKTKQQKITAGTHRPNREKKISVSQRLTFIPKPMMELTGDEYKYYDLCCSVLLHNGTLTPGDIPGISRASKTFQIYLEALKEVSKSGASQRTKSGFTSKSGAFLVVADCEKLLQNFEKSQGLNLLSRMKLPEPKQGKFYTEIDELINPAHKAGSLRNPADADFT